MDAKVAFNDLLSRLDTLHDFCDPSADAMRNKDALIDPENRKAISDEFANVFKPEILKALDKEDRIKNELGKHSLIPKIEILINKVIAKDRQSFFKADLANIMERVKNGLFIVNNMKATDKIKGRLSNFEPTVVAFYEYLYNAAFPEKVDNIGFFITNTALPIYDYLKSDPIPSPKDRTKPAYIDPPLSFTKQRVENKDSMVAFVLGLVDDDNDDDCTGFYKRGLSNQIDRFKEYLKDLRAIIGEYFQVQGKIINLILDTSNVSFSKYYLALKQAYKNESDLVNDVKIRVLCNVAMSWDGANSPQCEEGSLLQNRFNIVQNKETNKQERAIYDISDISLQQDATKTTVAFDQGPPTKIDGLPREVSKLSECIRQQIAVRNKKKRPSTKQCQEFKTVGRLLDIKRTGDALQALMVNQLNDPQNTTNEFSVFVTLDHLAFLKARMNGIPTVYTSLQKDKGVSNRVMILFNNNFTRSLVNLKEAVRQETKTYANISTLMTGINTNECATFIADHLLGVNTQSSSIPPTNPQKYYDQLLTYINKPIDAPIGVFKEPNNISLYSQLVRYATDQWNMQTKSFNTILGQNWIDIKQKVTNHTPPRDDLFVGQIPQIDSHKFLEPFYTFVCHAFILESLFHLKKMYVVSNFNVERENIEKNGDLNNLAQIQDQQNEAKDLPRILSGLDQLRAFNEKYTCFLKWQERLNKAETYAQVVGFDLDVYKNFINNLILDTNKLFAKEVYTDRLVSWEKKMNDPTFFQEAARISRNNPTVKDKIKEYTDLMTSPRGLTLVISDLLYSSVRAKCEAFFKERMAFLQVSKISKKAIDFQDAAKLIIQGVEVKPSPLLPPPPSIEPSRTKAVRAPKKLKVVRGRKKKGGSDEDDDIPAYPASQTLEEPSSETPPSDLELIDSILGSNVTTTGVYDLYIYQRYRAFFKDLLPSKYVTLDEPLTPADLEDWNMSNISPRLIDVLTNITKDTPSSCIMFLRKHLSKMMIDCLTSCIENYYTECINIASVDIDDPLFDIVIWIMVNDPGMLLYHTGRKEAWSDVEYTILECVKPQLEKSGGGFTPPIDLISPQPLSNSEPIPEPPAVTEQPLAESFEAMGLGLTDPMSDYMTLDDYIDTCIAFDPYYGLESNMKILCHYDFDGQPYSVTTQQRGGKNMRLMDYHRKYYKTYYHLYHP